MSLVQASTKFGSLLLAFDAHSAKLWQMHFNIKIFGMTSKNLEATELCLLIIIDAPSAAKPMRFDKYGILFSVKMSQLAEIILLLGHFLQEAMLGNTQKFYSCTQLLQLSTCAL